MNPFLPKLYLFLISFILAFSVAHFTFAQEEAPLDERIGTSHAQSIEEAHGLYRNYSINIYLNQLGRKLVRELDEKPAFDFSFKILNIPEPNAFALPGGHVYITRGLLCLLNNESELAAVLSHEIIHSAERHTIKHIKQSILPAILMLPGTLAGNLVNEDVARVFTPLNIGSQAIMAGYSRSHEKEADKKGVELLARAGYQPELLSSTLKRLSAANQHITGEEEKRSYLNKHPLTPRRVQYLERHTRKLVVHQDKPFVLDTKTDYLSLIKGIPAASDPDLGYFEGQTYIQPKYGFSIDFPEEWMTHKTASTIGAVDSTGAALIYMEYDSLFTSADSAALKTKPKMIDKFGRDNVKSMELDISGQPAQLLTIINTKATESYYLFVLWIDHQKHLFRIIGGGTQNFTNDIKAAAESFSVLSSKQLKQIEKVVIDTARLKAEESLATFNERTRNTWDVTKTALMNNIPENARLKKDMVFKIAIEQPYLED